MNGMPGGVLFLDALCFQPLSTLGTLTSLSLDFNYLYYAYQIAYLS